LVFSILLKEEKERKGRRNQSVCLTGFGAGVKMVREEKGIISSANSQGGE